MCSEGRWTFLGLLEEFVLSSTFQLSDFYVVPKFVSEVVSVNPGIPMTRETHIFSIT